MRIQILISENIYLNDNECFLGNEYFLFRIKLIIKKIFFLLINFEAMLNNVQSVETIYFEDIFLFQEKYLSLTEIIYSEENIFLCLNKLVELICNHFQKLKRIYQYLLVLDLTKYKDR